MAQKNFEREKEKVTECRKKGPPPSKGGLYFLNLKRGTDRENHKQRTNNEAIYLTNRSKKLKMVVVNVKESWSK